VIDTITDVCGTYPVAVATPTPAYWTVTVRPHRRGHPRRHCSRPAAHRRVMLCLATGLRAVATQSHGKPERGQDDPEQHQRVGDDPAGARTSGSRRSCRSSAGPVVSVGAPGWWITSFIYQSGETVGGGCRDTVAIWVTSRWAPRLGLNGARSHSARVAAVRIVTLAYVEEDRWPPQIRRPWRIRCPSRDRGVRAGGVDFFVSYTTADRPWAEWIAWELEDVHPQSTGAPATRLATQPFEAGCISGAVPTPRETSSPTRTLPRRHAPHRHRLRDP